MIQYHRTLQNYLPILALNATAIHLITIRTRLSTDYLSQEVDKKSFPFKEILKYFFLIFSPSSATPEEKRVAVQLLVDVQRNFLENVVPFGLLALGVSQVTKNPSDIACTAVKTFVISRTIHNILFIFYPYQPFRAFSFVPQVLANLALAHELYFNRA